MARSGWRFGKAVGFFLLMFVRCSSAQTAQTAESFALAHVTVVDVRSGDLSPDQTVVISRGKITSVSASAVAKSPADSQTIDCTGLYLIPGLWDMHVHLEFGDWFPQSKEISLPLFIANGVTGVRDMGSELETVQSWRKEIEAGNLIGPRIYTSGPMLDGPKPRFPSSIAIATPEDGRRAVADLKRRGADFIKLQSLIPRDAVFASADEAKKQHIAFEGHVPDSVRASEMSEAGMKGFEHLIGIFEGSSPLEDEFLKGNKNETRFMASYDPARAEKLAALLAKNHTWQCPTLVWERGGNLLDVTDFSKDDRAKLVPSSWKTGTWKRFTDEIEQGYATDNLDTRKKFLEKELEIVGLMHKKGVPFLAGTDTPPGVYIFPGFSLHEELQRFVAAGFTPLEALQTATLNPAQFFGVASQLGSIEPGKLADLVLLKANPLSDVANTQKIAAVLSRGRYFSTDDLHKLLSQVEGVASGANDSSVAAMDSQKLNMPGPEVQNTMLGSWAIHSEYPPDHDHPKGMTGEGFEIWRPGPGGYSVIEEAYEKNPDGELEEFIPAWWDVPADGQRFLYCSNTLPEGCSISSSVARWLGDRNVYEESVEHDGKKTVRREVFEDITFKSFSQSLAEGPEGGPLNPPLLIRAKRLGQPVPLQHRTLSSHNLRLKLANPAVLKMLLGTWAIEETDAPSESQPQGGSSRGIETWRAGPGGQSLIEEFHSASGKESFDGLGVLWQTASNKPLQLLWCRGDDSSSCSVDYKVHWNGNELVVETEQKRNATQIFMRETFSQITTKSFLQTIDTGASAATLKRSATIRATKLHD